MSWADVNLNDDPADALAKRIVDLEDTIATQFATLHEGLRIVAEAVSDLAARLDEGATASTDVDVLAARLQHAVLLAISSLEQPDVAHIGNGDDPLSTPATARDIARINTRIDDLRALLLG